MLTRTPWWRARPASPPAPANAGSWLPCCWNGCSPARKRKKRKKDCALGSLSRQPAGRGGSGGGAGGVSLAARRVAVHTWINLLRLKSVICGGYPGQAGRGGGRRGRGGSGAAKDWRGAVLLIASPHLDVPAIVYEQVRTLQIAVEYGPRRPVVQVQHAVGGGDKLQGGGRGGLSQRLEAGTRRACLLAWTPEASVLMSLLPWLPAGARQPPPSSEPSPTPHHGQAALPRQRGGDLRLRPRARQQLRQAAKHGILRDDGWGVVAQPKEVHLRCIATGGGRGGGRGGRCAHASRVGRAAGTRPQPAAPAPRPPGRPPRLPAQQPSSPAAAPLTMLGCRSEASRPASCSSFCRTGEESVSARCGSAAPPPAAPPTSNTLQATSTPRQLARYTRPKLRRMGWVGGRGGQGSRQQQGPRHR